MRKLCLTLFSVAAVACGSDAAKNPDAAKEIDAKPNDAKVFLDGAGSGSGSYDFSCFGGTPTATSADPITVSGTTSELTMNGLTPTDGVAVSVFKTGDATALASVTSANGGAFASGNLATGGTPIDAFIKAAIAANRTTYLYPPSPAHANLANVPVPLVSNSLFGFLQQVAGVTQNDATNGALLVILSDCAQSPISGATVSVKQGSSDVGTQYDLGQLSPMAAGTVAVFNVPDGSTTLTAKFGSMTFPLRTVASHKAANSVGSITATEVLPGPL